VSYATNEYTGNGATTNFALSFPYISPDHVSATVDGSTVAFTWLNASTITISPAPANLSTIRITRDSSRETRLVDFTNGAALTEVDLDLASTQAIYIAQEAFDASEAVQNTQALQDMVDAAEAAATSAQNAAASSTASASAASGSAVAADASADAAAASALAADASADAAALSEAAAAGYATSALLKANNLSDLVSASTARANLGLGTAATTAASAYATSAQGALADSALQPDALTTTEAATIVGDGSTSTFLLGKLLELKSATANTDGGRWVFGHLKSGAADFLSLFTVTDAGVMGSPVFQVGRTGTGSIATTFYNDVTLAGLSCINAEIATGGYLTFAGNVNSFMGENEFGCPAVYADQFSNNAVESLGTSLSGTPTFNLGTANRYSGTLTGNITPTLTAPPYPTTIRIMLTQDGTGSRTLTLPSSVKWPASYDATAKALTTTASAKDLLILDWDGAIYVANLLKGLA
jgi:hypothetical protein